MSEVVASIRYCKCGCGQPVQNNYKRGHHRLGFKCSAETVEKLRANATGKKQTGETKMKRHLAMLGNKNPFFGKRHTEETQERIRLKKLGVPIFSEEEKRRRALVYSGEGNPFYGRHHTEEVKMLLSNTLHSKGKNHPRFGKKNSDYAREKSREANLGMRNPNWGGMTDIHREKILKSLHSLPTKPEKHLLTLIENNGFPFKYVGNGEVFIARKCPDFINSNHKKQLIELCGNYWHTQEEMQERVGFFAKYGFSTLLVWESELKDEEAVINKIRQFVNK